MNKALLGFLIALLLAAHVATLALILRKDDAAGGRGERSISENAAVARLEEAIASLNAKVDRLSQSMPAEPRREGELEGGAPAQPDAPVVERLAAIEKLLAERRNLDDELAAARIREEREARFRSDEGFMAADELVAEKKFALAGNGYLKFLEFHPDHPDTRDLMGKARDAFLNAGYADKAFWVHQEMMNRFPENRDQDLMALAMMEKDARKLDEAIQHAEEAAALAKIDEDKVWRLLYRAWYVQLRDGDAAGLASYRELEPLVQSLGLNEKNPGKKLREKIAELEQRVAQGR